MDALLLLENDHRTVEALFRQFHELSDAGRRSEVAAEIRQELSVHAAIEEMQLYPVVREAVDGGDAEADEALKEHQAVKELLASLEKTAIDDPRFESQMSQLEQDVAHHVKDEETEMFPALRQKLSAARMDDLGTSLEQAKKTAPTHPHPHAPNKPPGNVVAGPVAAAVDKVRDLASGKS